MKLSEWLHGHRETQSDFAGRPEIGVHPMTVAKWVTGRAVPRPARMAAIERVTGGAVRANDFYGNRPAGETESDALTTSGECAIPASAREIAA
jgi:DNA-binding transcriptional regulator YdaS (Cro superfamily)